MSRDTKELLFMLSVFIGLAVFGILVLVYAGMDSKHTAWQECVNFCQVQHAYHDNQRQHTMCECKALSDHHTFLIDTTNGQHYEAR